MRRTSWREHGYHALLWLVALIFFAPILWIVLCSFKTADQILAVPPKFIFMRRSPTTRGSFPAPPFRASCSTVRCCRSRPF